MQSNTKAMRRELIRRRARAIHAKEAQDNWNLINSTDRDRSTWRGGSSPDVGYTAYPDRKPESQPSEEASSRAWSLVGRGY